MVGHIVPPVAQEHAPMVQTSPCSQALLQLPQCAGSVAGFVQTWAAPTPQVTSPIGHVQTPETQLSPVAHW
jgi:hypothetical protein